MFSLLRIKGKYWRAGDTMFFGVFHKDTSAQVRQEMNGLPKILAIALTGFDAKYFFWSNLVEFGRIYPGDPTSYA